MSNLNDINLEEVKLKLYERLKPSGWANVLKTFILSDAFDSILLELLKEAQSGSRFTPPLKSIFRAFEECPYKDLKVVWLSQDPYPKIDIADGIAFSCKNNSYVPASLKFIFKELETTVYPTSGYTWDTDLARWSNQGILMINSAFTTQIGKVGTHYKIWEPFLAFLLDILGSFNPGLIYVFVGKVAQGWISQVKDNNHLLLCSHPASAAHNLKELWDSNDVFNKISFLMWSQYKHKMIW